MFFFFFSAPHRGITPSATSPLLALLLNIEELPCAHPFNAADPLPTRCLTYDMSTAHHTPATPLFQRAYRRDCKTVPLLCHHPGAFIEQERALLLHKAKTAAASIPSYNHEPASNPWHEANPTHGCSISETKIERKTNPEVSHPVAESCPKKRGEKGAWAVYTTHDTIISYST